MKIIGSNYFNEIIFKRDLKREEFIKKQMKTTEKYEAVFIKSRKKAKNDMYLFAYAIFAWIIFVVIQYEMLYARYTHAILVLLGIIVLWFLFKAIKSYINKKKIYKQWEMANADDEKIKKQANTLNNQAAKTAIAIMCFSENFYLFKHLDHVQYYKKWGILSKQYVDAIQEEHNYSATADDIIIFYEAWREKKAI